ncbi:unnamed protein product [Moneuplotes crassus]|uniref:Uncharacterized protein n=1 Tax=Euplotes crassus TaxID=5936 RepID=A0AAD2D6Q6_EUPCR|nr:unnamed protein product [Moneuplotes crassus]
MSKQKGDNCRSQIQTSSGIGHELSKEIYTKDCFRANQKEILNIHVSQDTIKTDDCSLSSKSKASTDEVDYSFFSQDLITHGLFGDITTTSPGFIDPFYNQSDLSVYSYCPLTPKQNTSEPKGRPDIKRRKMLRNIKRFYYELFKHHNNKLFYLRLKRITSSVIIEALRHFCEVYISKAHAEEMAQFMFKFLNINCAGHSSEESRAMRNGKKVYECTYSYSISKFDSLFESEHFRILILSYAELQQSSILRLQEMKSQAHWPNRLPTQEGSYLSIISKHLLKSRGAKLEASLQETCKRCQSY